MAGGRGQGGRIGLGVVVLHPQAAVEVELLAQLDGVERVRCRSGRRAARVDAIEYGRKRGDGIVDARLVQIGSIVAVDDAKAAAPKRILLFRHEFKAARNGMRHAAQREFSHQVGLIGKDLVILQYRLARSRDGPGGRRAAGGGGNGIHAGQNAINVGLAVAGNVRQFAATGQVVLNLHGQHIGMHLFKIAVNAVKIVRVDARAGAYRCVPVIKALQADTGNAAVGQLVLADVLRLQRHAGGRAQTQRQRRRNAERGVLEMVAPRDAAILRHHVQAQCAGRAEGPIDIGRDALVAGAVDAGGTRVEVVRLGVLGGQVDIAGRGAAANVGSGGAFGYFDLFNIEGVARDGAEVAHAVDENRRLGGKPAHLEGVAGAGVAVFAHLQRNAGRVAQGIDN